MLLTLCIIYVLLCIAGCALQRKLIYFPTKISADVAKQAAVQEGFLAWTNVSGEIIGWHMPAKGKATGSVLVVHGNGGCALNRSYFAQPIHEAANVDVFVLEYPGYGARSGSPSLKSFLAAAEEAFDQLPAGQPRYVVSESLGTGVSAHLAKVRRQKIDGMALFVPYDDLLSLAKLRMRFLPVSLILLDRFQPAACLAEYRGPIKFIIAEQDEVIPARLGLKLHEGFSGPKVLEVIPGAHHNEVGAQSAQWWRAVFDFWQKNRPALDNSTPPR